VFLGREIGEQRDYGEQAAEDIDAEVRRILTHAYDRAKQILSDNRDKMEVLVKALMERETLDRNSFEEIMKGNNPFDGLNRPPTPPPAAPAPSAPPAAPPQPFNPAPQPATYSHQPPVE